MPGRTTYYHTLIGDGSGEKIAELLGEFLLHLQAAGEGIGDASELAKANNLAFRNIAYCHSAEKGRI